MKVLVVDDDVIARMALIDLLSDYAMFDLLEADDGQSAWTLLEDGLRPVICFCDVRMPRMSGIDLLQKIKEHPAMATLPVVLVSSASDRDTVLQAVQLGAVGYILKPLHPADARAHLEKIFKLTVDKLIEPPAATMRRLNIGTDRLRAYLKAFGEQVELTRAELGPLLDAGRGADCVLRIEAMHNGCMTLGLWQAAEQFKRAREGVFDSVRIEQALAAAADCAARQTRRAAAAPGAA
jgi:two-component system, chemotaxis family, chemotaxis protein CheY